MAVRQLLKHCRKGELKMTKKVKITVPHTNWGTISFKPFYKDVLSQEYHKGFPVINQKGVLYVY